MTADTIETIQVTHTYDAPPERVFDAWLDPEGTKHWLFTDKDGQLIRAEIDARHGGEFLFTDRRAEGDIDHVGQYEDIDRPNSLSFNFKVPRYLQDMSSVALEFTPQGEGCIITLTSGGVPPEWAAQTRDGWQKILQALEDYLMSETLVILGLDPRIQSERVCVRNRTVS